MRGIPSWRLAALAAVCLALVACGGDPAPTPTDKASDPAAAPSEASDPTGAESPNVAAKGLYAAWQSDDRAKAERFATKPAIKELFAEGGGGMEFAGPCTKGKGGKGFTCAFRYEGGSLSMDVEGNAAKGFLVADVKFVVD